MKFEVNGTEYELEKDAHQWILSEWTETKEGKHIGSKVKRNSTFHANLTQAAGKLVDKHILLPEEGASIAYAIYQAIDAMQGKLGAQFLKENT